MSNTPTPFTLLKEAEQSASKYEIKYKYNAEEFEKIEFDPKFVNTSQEEWQKVRSEWVSQIPSSEPPDYDEWAGDIDHILTHLSKYQPFSEPVPLELMAELLEVVWVDAPSM